MTDTQAKALMGDMLAIYKARTLEEIADRLEERAEEEQRRATQCRQCGCRRHWPLAGELCRGTGADHTWIAYHSGCGEVLREEATKIRSQAKELRGG